MPYAIELYFDKATEDAVYQMWKAIADAGFKSPMLDAGYRPHISLAVYDYDLLDIEHLQQDLAAYAKAISPFDLVLPNISIFPTSEGVIFLGATVTQKLLEEHTNFHRSFEKYADYLRPYYAVGNWIPHCTLSFGVSAQESAKIIPISWEISLPIYAKVQEIGLAKVSPSKCDFIFCYSLDTGQPNTSDQHDIRMNNSVMYNLAVSILIEKV